MFVSREDHQGHHCNNKALHALVLAFSSNLQKNYGLESLGRLAALFCKITMLYQRETRDEF
jgi:hypothetical protein